MISLIGLASACEYHDHGDCLVNKTIVEGRVLYNGDSNQPVEGATVQVTCIHNGNQYTQNAQTKIGGGFLAGTYIVQFPQSQCISGDEVIVVAYKGSMTGENDGEIVDWINNPCVDIDIGLVDVPLVPEFGVIIGTLTVLSAVGIFFFVRRE